MSLVRLKRVWWSRLSQLIFAFLVGFTTSFFFFSLDAPLKESSEIGFSRSLPDILEPTSDNLLLVVLIFTSAKNTDRRDCIRETWLSFAQSRQVSHHFVIGTTGLSSVEIKQIENENNLHHDLLLLRELKDTYSNLTLKLLQSLVWISDIATYGHHFEYLLKVDDDSFVRLDLLYDELIDKHVHFKERSSDPVLLYWGYFDGRAHVKQRGQWKESKWFLCDRYLPYALGGGYVISKHLVHFLANHSRHLAMYQSEDVSLGVWLAPLAINRLHDIRFDTEFKSRGCNDNYLIQHKQSPPEMKAKYKSLLNYDRLCANGESEHRLVYNYNWNVLPSKCCVRNLSLIKPR